MTNKKMTGKNVFATLIVATLLAFPFAQAQALSLNEALAIAYENNPDIKASRAEMQAVDESMPQAISGWLPKLTANYSIGSETGSINNGKEKSTSPDSESLSLSQSIFSGGSTMAEIKHARNRILSARASLKQKEQDILNKAINAYVEVVRAREVLHLNQNNEKVLQEQLETTKVRFSLGETTKTDVEQAKSRLASAESNRISAEGSLIAVESLYKKIFEADAPAEMTMPKLLPEIPSDLKSALDLATVNYPPLLTAQFDNEAAKQRVKMATAKLLPEADVSGNINKTGGGSVSGINTSSSESVTLNVSIPLYQSGAEYSRIRQSKRNRENAEFELRSAYNNAIDTATKAWQQIQTSRASIKATTAAVEAAQLALDGVSEEQQVGTRTTLDVLDAEQELFDAQVQLVTAKRNEVLAVYNLKTSLGELNAKNLGLDVKIYDPEEHYNEVKYKVFGF